MWEGWREEKRKYVRDRVGGDEIQRPTENKILKVNYSFVALIFSFVAAGVARSGGMCTTSFGVFLLTTSLARMQATGVLLVKRSF